MNWVVDHFKKIKQSNVGKIILINLIIFVFGNWFFNLKYEQVDDFIIYNLYSGLDGTYNLHGIYIHPVICFIISLFFRVIPTINWHTIFLLSMQFICFTIIGTILMEKHKNQIALVLYTILASVCYLALLLLIQYTSVSALLILTAFFMLMDELERERNKKSYKIAYTILFTIGIMTRMQSLLIIAPFFGIYAIYCLIRWKQKKLTSQKMIKLIKEYSMLGMMIVLVYLSNYLIYQKNDLYKEYMEYNDIRAVLHDMSYTDYEEYQETFEEIGWSKNDHYLFYTFNFGDEEVYSKENLQKILDDKISKNEYYNLNLNGKMVGEQLAEEMTNTNTYICIVFLVMFFLAISTNPENMGWNLIVLMVTLGIHILFIILNRSMLRVVIPEYILGTAILIYFTKWKPKQEKEKSENYLAILILAILVIVVFSGKKYEFNYKLEDYRAYQKVIEYTNSHKENVYLYTVPSLQFRYLAYSVYQMPPKGSFSNLRVMGGWDMFTGNYYDFKRRYNLDGNFLDLLKDNVYLIDGKVNWSGNYYQNYMEHIVLFIKEHNQKEVTYEKIEEFENIAIYKIKE